MVVNQFRVLVLCFGPKCIVYAGMVKTLLALRNYFLQT
jgi:hypothetical protein